jgi:TonB family protein
MISLIAEYSVRSIALGLLVFLAVKALRVRDPRLERTVWRIVLMSVVSMPALLKLSSLLPVPAPALSASYGELVTLPTPDSISGWSTALLVLLAAISCLLVFRHFIGVARCWALRQRATRMEPSTDGLDLRMSGEVVSPATIFSTVLVPTDFGGWTPEAQRLALAHERSHVVSKDFYVQCLAQIYRSLFWFNPFAWWLAARLAMLNEHVSDDAAIDSRDEHGRDERARYAKVLLSLAQRATANAHLVPMIRAHSLSTRIERILRQTVTSQASAPRTLWVACALLAPIVVATAAIRSPSPHGNHADSLQLVGSSHPAAQIVLPKSNPAMPLSHPQYPPSSRRIGETGTVVLKLHVLEDGTVADAAIEKSSGYPDLDYAAFYESFRWRLDPGTVDGAPARMWGRFAVTFKLAKD